MIWVTSATRASGGTAADGQERISDQRVMVGIQEQHRVMLADPELGDAVDEDAILQLTLVGDAARDHDALGMPLMVLRKGAPELGPLEFLVRAQPGGATLLLDIGK